MRHNVMALDALLQAVGLSDLPNYKMLVTDLSEDSREVKPGTLFLWHGKGYRLYWTWKSQ